MSANTQLQLARVRPLRFITKLFLKLKYNYFHVEKNNALIPTVYFAFLLENSFPPPPSRWFLSS